MTKRMQPSPAQRRVLEAMAAGRPFWQGITSRMYFLRGDLDALTRVHTQTAKAVIHAGWAERMDGTFGDYRITALGRHALAEAERQAGE